MHIEMTASRHAVVRQAQRNMSDADVAFVLEHGRQVRCAGALHVFLGRRDIPADRETQRRFGHLEGTVLVLADDNSQLVLITAYRNREALKEIRAKAKYRRAMSGPAQQRRAA